MLSKPHAYPRDGVLKQVQHDYEGLKTKIAMSFKPIAIFMLRYDQLHIMQSIAGEVEYDDYYPRKNTVPAKNLKTFLLQKGNKAADSH